MAPPKPDPYNFDPKFERAVVVLCASNPQFWARVGHALDPDALGGPPEAALILRSAREFAEDAGGGPSSSTMVLQHLRRRMGEGKVTYEQCEAAGLYFGGVGPGGDASIDPEQAVAALAPILRRRAEADALKRGFDAYAARGDVGQVIDLVSAAQRIGAAGVSRGIVLGSDAAWDRLAEPRGERLGTGVLELDDLLGGGWVRGELNVVSMRTGGGKSVSVGQFIAQAVWQGLHAAVATTEVDEQTWLARVTANLTAVPIDQILAGPSSPGFARARARIAELAPQLGPCTVRYFTPGVTTVADVREWARLVASQAGRPVDALAVDSADDLVAPQSKGKELPGYERVKVVFSSLRSLVKDELNAYGWTPSQPKGASSTGRARKRIDTDDLADGMGKARVCDKLLVAEVDDDQSTITFSLPKNRTGRARRSTSPIPLDFSCGMVGPVVRFPAGGAR